MNRDGILFFHHNLNFSSIPFGDHRLVIEKCYVPLLALAKNTGTIVNIEMSAWTLERCMEIMPDYVNELKKAIDERLVEFVGSGFCQIIGPLFPYELNKLNQELGIQVYEKILGKKPKTVLMNEKASSAGLIDVYLNSGYETIIIEADNVALANGFLSKDALNQYGAVISSSGNPMSVFWTDSILFQKFQRVVHGDTSISDYLCWISEALKSGKKVLPIYSTDIEVFGFRPGRFKTEALIGSNEWATMEALINRLKDGFQIRFLRLSDIVYPKMKLKTIGSISYPIPVKKQPKYNLARWAVTGRNDQKLNTLSYKLIKQYNLGSITNLEDLKSLCYICSSDLRTHVSEDKWSMVQDLGSDLSKRFLPAISSEMSKIKSKKFDVSPEKYGRRIISIKNEFAELNLRLDKGLSIDSLCFSELKGGAVGIRSFDHGFFTEIDYGADFFSGTVVYENQRDLERHTDFVNLNSDKPVSNGYEQFEFETSFARGSIFKRVGLEANTSSFLFEISARNIDVGRATFRMGNFCFSNIDEQTFVSFSTGGPVAEVFQLDGNFDHSAAVSALVSSSKGMGIPEGSFSIWNRAGGVEFDWDNSQAFLYPMLRLNQTSPVPFCRLIFSLSEIDDTSRDNFLDFSAQIRIRPIGPKG